MTAVFRVYDISRGSVSALPWTFGDYRFRVYTQIKSNYGNAE